MPPITGNLPTGNLLCVLALVVAIAPLSGCRTLRNESPVSQTVVEGRQLTQQGVNAMDRGDWSRAESLLERAVKTCGESADARRNYAETLAHRGARIDALAQLEAARELAPGDPALAVRTGELQLELGAPAKASDLVDEALKLDPKFAPAWTLRGRIAMAAGRPREALADFQRSLGYAPREYRVNLLVAEVYRQLNEPARALVALQAVADQYPPGDEPQEVLHMEGLALTALRRYDDAARVLAQASQRERPSADLLCHLAEAELMSGRGPHAQYSLQQALALDPSHAASRALMARMATSGKPVLR